MRSFYVGTACIIHAKHDMKMLNVHNSRKRDKNHMDFPLTR